MRQRTPADLNLSGVDLKSATTYSSPILAVGKEFQFNLFLKVTNTGAPTLGLAKIVVKIFDDAAGTNEIDSLDIVTAINTKVNGQRERLSWGGTGASHGGSGSLDGGSDALAVAQFIRVDLVVTEANNGTTSVGSAWLLSEEFSN